VSRFSPFFFRNRRYNDISVSIQEHIDERIDELMEEGMSRDVAERTARRDFGNVALFRERSREVWQWQRLESLLVDLKHVCRRLGRSPGFAITVVLTLAIGIGANTAVFSVLLRPLPYPEPQQLVSLHLNAPGAPGLAEFRNELRLSASMYLTFAAHNRAFQSIGVWGPGTASITGIAQPEQVNTAQISSGVLETLNVPAFTGQWLTAADQDSHGLGRVMLSYGYWQRRFGGDPSVVGRTISVNSQPRVIVGVMPRGFKSSITTSISWFRWPSIRSRSTWLALLFVASRGSGRGLALHRRMPMWRTCSMSGWTHGRMVQDLIRTST
jgi:hypothetical protein